MIETMPGNVMRRLKRTHIAKKRLKKLNPFDICSFATEEADLFGGEPAPQTFSCRVISASEIVEKSVDDLMRLFGQKPVHTDHF